MLLQLEFKNLATFPSARLEFGQGLNILSGMSGAGKSVILGALNLVLGERFSQKFIREGEDKAEVSALFVLEPNILKTWKESLDLEGDEILIQRQFKREGRTLNYLNDKMIGSDKLKQLGQALAQTLNQDEAIGLRDPNKQLLWLDAYGSIDTSAYRETYLSWKKNRDRLAELQSEVQEASQQRQFLEFQLAELQKLNLKEGEMAELEEGHQLLANSVEIETNGMQLAEAGDEFASRALAPLDELESLLQDHPSFKALLEEGRSLQISLEEWSRTFRGSLSEIESDPARLMEVENRLAELRSITKKFQMEESELIARQNELEAQLSGPPAEIEIQQLESETKELEAKALKQANDLDKERQKVAKKISREINQLLSSLEMEGDRFSIAMQKDTQLGPKGISVLDFQLKPTADGPSMSLSECASGGERSRALLAISSALSNAMGVGLLVFDEIDTNIGSRLGRPISEAFLGLSDSTQVICVTHLAPVAACGEKHFLVEKGSQFSEVNELSEQKRLEELAQMIAGEKDSPAAREQAEHMLNQYRGRRA